MEIKSASFLHGGQIPQKYTCEGSEMSPPLAWNDLPKGTKSLVLIMEDPDVPAFVREDRLWVHWVIYNIPPSVSQIEENKPIQGFLGVGTGGMKGYQGPCPPDREHRYFFKLYALDCMLALEDGAFKEQVEEAMKGHVLDSCELIGRYCKKNSHPS